MRFKVVPSTEATLPEAGSGLLIGGISATANLNADLCACPHRSGDDLALVKAVAVRRLFDAGPLVAGISALLAPVHHDAQWARVQPPFTALPTADHAAVTTAYDTARANCVA